MADYYSLIAKAVAGLENAQERRTLYERGRNALLDELGAIRSSRRSSFLSRRQSARWRPKWHASTEGQNKLAG
jgi:hypothetical protein